MNEWQGNHGQLSWDNKLKKIAQANNIRFKEIIKIDDVKKEEKK